MGELPQISGRKLIKTLMKFGYTVVRQKGSHIRLVHILEKTKKPLTVPDHKVIGKGLMYKILRDAELDLEMFLQKLK